jgi:hypothetical protein
MSVKRWFGEVEPRSCFRTFRSSTSLSRPSEGRRSGRFGLVSGGGRPPGWFDFLRWVRSMPVGVPYASEPGGEEPCGRGVRVNAC